MRSTEEIIEQIRDEIVRTIYYETQQRDKKRANAVQKVFNGNRQNDR